MLSHGVILRYRRAPSLSRGGIALLLALLTACTQTNRAPQTVNVFQVAQQREPASLNPALENGQSATEWGFLLFSFLVKYDESGRLIGDVATQVPSLEN